MLYLSTRKLGQNIQNLAPEGELKKLPPSKEMKRIGSKPKIEKRNGSNFRRRKVIKDVKWNEWLRAENVEETWFQKQVYS